MQAILTTTGTHQGVLLRPRRLLMWQRAFQHHAVAVALSEEANYTRLQVLHLPILLHSIAHACAAREGVEHPTVTWSDDAQIVTEGTLRTPSSVHCSILLPTASSAPCMDEVSSTLLRLGWL